MDSFACANSEVLAQWSPPFKCSQCIASCNQSTAGTKLLATSKIRH